MVFSIVLFILLPVVAIKRTITLYKLCTFDCSTCSDRSRKKRQSLIPNNLEQYRKTLKLSMLLSLNKFSYSTSKIR